MSFIAFPHNDPRAQFLKAVGIRPAIRLDVSDKVDSLLRQTPKDCRALAVLKLCGIRDAEARKMLGLSESKYEALVDGVREMHSEHEVPQRSSGFDDVDGDIAELIRFLYAKHFSYKMTAEALNDIGIRTAFGNKWTERGLKDYCARHEVKCSKKPDKVKRRLIELYDQGVSRVVIIETLNSEGLKTSYGRLWTMKALENYIDRNGIARRAKSAKRSA